MPICMIEFKEKARGELESWAYRVGTKKEIRACAIDLLISLVEQGYRTARVFVDGKGVQPTEEERARIKKETSDASSD